MDSQRPEKLPAEQIGEIDRILDLLDEIEELPKDLLSFVGLAIHALKGDLAGFWSVRVTGNYGSFFALMGRMYPKLIISISNGL